MAVQQVQNLPPQFIQDIGKDLATQITAQTAVPVVTTGIAGIITTTWRNSSSNFKARQDAARAFSTRQESLAGLAPQVAQRDALQTQAQTISTSKVLDLFNLFNSCTTSRCSRNYIRWYCYRGSNNTTSSRLYVPLSITSD